MYKQLKHITKTFKILNFMSLCLINFRLAVVTMMVTFTNMGKLVVPPLLRFNIQL